MSIQLIKYIYKGDWGRVQYLIGVRSKPLTNYEFQPVGQLVFIVCFRQGKKESQAYYTTICTEQIITNDLL